MQEWQVKPYHDTGWQRCIECMKLQVSFPKRATNYRALLQKWHIKPWHNTGWRRCIKLQASFCERDISFCERATHYAGGGGIGMGWLISRLLKITGFFCRISPLLKSSFAKETYNLKEPTNCSHTISIGFLKFQTSFRKRATLQTSFRKRATTYALYVSSLSQFYTEWQRGMRCNAWPSFLIIGTCDTLSLFLIIGTKGTEWQKCRCKDRMQCPFWLSELAMPSAYFWFSELRHRVAKMQRQRCRGMRSLIFR